MSGDNSQAVWWISPTGSNSASGLTPETAIRTWSEYARRVRGKRIVVNSTVHIEPGTYAEDVELDLYVAAGLTVTITGERTALYTSTFTGVTDWDFTSEVQGRYVDTALPVGWADSGLVDKLVSFQATGEAWSWVAAPNIGDPKSALTSPAVDMDRGDNVEPGIGTAFTVWDFPTLQGTLSIRCSNADGRTAPVALRYLQFAPLGFVPPVVLYDGDPRFEACDFAGGGGTVFLWSGFPVFFACRYQAATQSRGAGTMFLSGGMFLDHLDASFGGSISVDYRTLGYGADARLGCFSSGILEILFADYGIALVDVPVGIRLQAFSVARCFGKIWGNGTGPRALEVQQGALYEYAAGEAPNVTGFTADARIGGVSKTFAELPYTEVDQLAAVREIVV